MELTPQSRCYPWIHPTLPPPQPQCGYFCSCSSALCFCFCHFDFGVLPKKPKTLYILANTLLLIFSLLRRLLADACCGWFSPCSGLFPNFSIQNTRSMLYGTGGIYNSVLAPSSLLAAEYRTRTRTPHKCLTT